MLIDPLSIFKPRSVARSKTPDSRLVVRDLPKPAGEHGVGLGGVVIAEDQGLNPA